MDPLIRRLRATLAKPVPADPYLTEISGRISSHAFLRGCTQAVFIRQVDFLTQLLRARSGREPNEIRLLDWGCGKGHIAYLLRRQGFDVLASDRAYESGDSAFGQQTPILTESGIEVVPLTDPIRLPFPDDHFDCITSFGVLEHVTSDQGSLREIHRVLKKPGFFYVTFLPYFLSWTQALARLRGNSYHDRLYKQRQVTDLATQAGFEIEAMWLAQLFPKNSIPYRWDALLEPVDRVLCRLTPLGYFATNLEIVMRAC
jgi:SAM-dependent methyltransferase